MSNRTAIVASAAVAISIFSITSLAAQTAASPASKETAAAEDQCLAGPKATTPAGGHWYYRLEKGTKRKCWYLGDAGAKVNKSAAQKPAPADVATADEEDAPPPPAKKPAPKSFANARAELRAGAPDEDPSLAETTWPALPSAADATSHQDSPTQDNQRQDIQRQDNLRQDNQAAAIQPVPQPSSTQGWNIASRWPEAKAVASADAPPAAISPEPARPAPVLTPDRLAAAATPAAVAAPAAAAPTSAAAETSDSEMFSIRIALALLVGLLALAAIIGPMIFKYARPRRREQQHAPRQRRPIWDMDIARETVRQDNPRMASPALHADTLPEPRVLDEAVDELENLLARASKRSAA